MDVLSRAGSIQPDFECMHQPDLCSDLIERKPTGRCPICGTRKSIYNKGKYCYACRERKDARKSLNDLSKYRNAGYTAYKYVGRDKNIAPIKFYPAKIDLAQSMGYPDYVSALEGITKKSGAMVAGVTFGIMPETVVHTLRKVGVFVDTRHQRRRAALTYISTKPCSVCGSAVRYVCNGACVECARKKSDMQARKRAEKEGRKFICRAKPTLSNP